MKEKANVSCVSKWQPAAEWAGATRHAGRETEFRQTDRETDKPAGRQTDRQTNKQESMHAGRETDT